MDQRIPRNFRPYYRHSRSFYRHSCGGRNPGQGGVLSPLPRRALYITVISAPEPAHEVRPFHSWEWGIPLALSRVEGAQERNGRGLYRPIPSPSMRPLRNSQSGTQLGILFMLVNRKFSTLDSRANGNDGYAKVSRWERARVRVFRASTD